MASSAGPLSAEQGSDEKGQQKQGVGGKHRVKGDAARAVGDGDGFFHEAEARAKMQRNR